MREFIDVAAQLGAPLLRVTAGQKHPGVARADGVEWAVQGLTACLDEAKAAGVTLAYENHTKGYAWTYFDFSQPADIFLEIFDKTEGSGLEDPIRHCQHIGNRRRSGRGIGASQTSGSHDPRQ